MSTLSKLSKPKTETVGNNGEEYTIARKCTCGEYRPAALTQKNGSTICEECKRVQQDKTTTDRHHLSGRANSPFLLIVPANDHMAELSPAQREWPKQTLSNTERSPLLAAAAFIRGFVDTVLAMVNHGLLFAAKLLELLDGFLQAKLGAGWWLGTDMEKYAPGGTIHAR